MSVAKNDNTGVKLEVPRVTDVMRKQRRNNPVQVQRYRCNGTVTARTRRCPRATCNFKFTHSSVIYVIQKLHQTSVDAVFTIYAATLTRKLIGVGPTNATHVAVRK